MYRLFDASSIPILLEVWRAASQGQPWTLRACRPSWAFWTSYRLNIHHEHFENCELFEHLEHFEHCEHIIFWAAWAFWTSWAFWTRTRKQYKIVIIWSIVHTWYLSFFLRGQNFWSIKFTPKKRVNYDKIHSKLPIYCVITAKYTVNCQIFALNL